MTDNENIAANLAAARHNLGMTLNDLAAAANVSKSTLHDIERNAANPRLDTLYAIADALDLNLGDLIAARSPTIEVTRADQGAIAAGMSVTARLLHRIARAGDVEVYDITLSADKQESEPHRSGTSECLIVHSGTVEVGPSGTTATLQAGDSAWFATDTAHTYRSLDGPATATLIVTNPPHR